MQARLMQCCTFCVRDGVAYAADFETCVAPCCAVPYGKTGP